MKLNNSILTVILLGFIVSCSQVEPELKIMHQVTGPIKAIHSPGHSPGSVCYLVDGKLLSGDVLFYRNVGETVLQNTSREALVKSVRRLYKMLPDSTQVYPGHGQFTDLNDLP